MINGLYIFQHPSGILLYDKNFEESKIDPDLFSGLLSAIRNFASAIHMGELTSFTTHDKKIQISLTQNIVVAVVLDLNESIEKWQGIAYDVGYQFSSNYSLENFTGNRTQFQSFSATVDEILKKPEESFVVKVAKWATKEFGGDIHIDQKLMTAAKKDIPLDVIIDRGELKNIRLREKAITKFYKGYNRDLIFIKASEEIIGLNELEEFIASCTELGYECHTKERCEQYFDYFPSKIIIIAPEFSPPALDKIQELTYFDKGQEKHFILSNQIGKHTKKIAKKGSIRVLQCHVELWKWKTPYPERIFS